MIEKIAWWIAVLGGLHVGIIGAFKYDLLSKLGLGGDVTRIVYIVVGVAAVWLLLTAVRFKK